MAGSGHGGDQMSGPSQFKIKSREDIKYFVDTVH